MTKKPIGCLAVAVLLTGMVLAGCVGSEAGGQAQADNSTDPADDVEQEQNTTDTDASVDDGNATDDASEEETKSYRVPSDAMSAEPADTAEGMAHFHFEESGPTDVLGVKGDAGEPAQKTFSLSDPGDLTFFDVYVDSQDDKATWDVDYDLFLYEGDDTSGDPIASSTDGGAREYIFWQPDGDQAQNYTIEVRAWTSVDASWTMDVWAWTHEDWNASHPWTDVWERSYEIGQLEVAIPGCPDAVGQVAFCALSGVIGWTHGPAADQLTSDNSYDWGGYIWYGCGNGGNANVNPNGSGPRSLPCPDEPYTKVSVVINDDTAGQQVAAIWTTCSNDGDIYCGETDNLNDTKCEGDCAGPNELTSTFCGVVNGITRDATTDHDGTGPGIWDQRGEMYKTANGTYQEHPGVEDMVLFLVGPQRGGGGICPDANPYTGPTQGTITIIAQK